MTIVQSAYAAYLAALEQSCDLSRLVRPFQLGKRGEDFTRRRWLCSTNTYLSHKMVSFLDAETEVEVKIDEDADTYSYRSPQYHSRILTRPLAEIALYQFCVGIWLDDLAKLIGIESRHLSQQRERVPGHLWHLGGIDVGGTELAPVFVARQWKAAPIQKVTSVLADPVWARPGVVVIHQKPDLPLPGGHEARALSEFVRTVDGHDHFEATAFGRVLRSLASLSGGDEQAQYLRGNLLKLPHFAEAKTLSDERLKLIKAMWGQDGAPPPINSWAEANLNANTGYTSFDDAFAWDRLKWTDFFERISHGKYRLRRNP
jgi:hypothetical protein